MATYSIGAWLLDIVTKGSKFNPYLAFVTTAGGVFVELMDSMYQDALKQVQEENKTKEIVSVPDWVADTPSQLKILVKKNGGVAWSQRTSKYKNMNFWHPNMNFTPSAHKHGGHLNFDPGGYRCHKEEAVGESHFHPYVYRGTKNGNGYKSLKPVHFYEY